jgi:hypothetical protein
MEKPYIQKLDEFGPFTVYEVDGFYIRNNLDREFTNFGQHYRFRFIPKFEFWIDKEFKTDEEKFYITHLLKEWNLMDSGVDYDTAITLGDKAELKERSKTKQMIKAEDELKETHKPPKEIYVQKLEEYSKYLNVWRVNGELVRDLYFIDYTEGGHHYVYHWIPKNEVWIDGDLNPKEIPFVLLHELHERHLMAQGWSYGKAHNSSSIVEYHCRTNPKVTFDYLLQAIDDNKE